VALLGILKNYGLLSLVWILPAYLAQGTLRLASLLVTRRFEDAFQVLAAWGWNIAHLPGTLRRRVRAQAVRSVPDRSVRRTMAPAWIRARRLAQAVTQAVLPDLGAPPMGEPVPVRARMVRLVVAHPVATATVLGVMLAAVAYRHLLGPSTLTGGGIPAFPPSPSDFFRELFSGLRHTGLGGTDPGSPALGLLGLGSVLALGSPLLLQKVLLLGLPAAAAAGCYRAVRPHTGATVPAVVAAACYALSGIVLWSISEGRIPVLVFLAGLPWLAEKVRVAFDPDRHSNRVRWVAGAGLGLAALASFFPATILALAVILLSCLVVPSARWTRTRGAVLTTAGAGVAAILALPVSIGLLRSGGLGLADLAGEPAFLKLARLSPGGGPGDWPTGLFLPLVAAAALLFVSGRQGPTAIRAALAATISVYLAWASAAGYLPVPLSNAVAYLGVAALGYSVVVGLGLTVLSSGVAAASFGHRQVGAAIIGALLVAGLGAQGFQAARGSWAVGEPDRVPAAYSLVAQAPSPSYRVLWLGSPDGDSFAAPGGLPDGTVPAGPASVRFAVRGPAGSSALDVGRSPAGAGFGSLRVALTEILAGQTRHGGSLLGPFAVRFVVAEPADLPPRTLRMLLRQFDLDVVPAEGLRIFQNSKAVPLAGEIEDPAWVRAAENGGHRSVIPLAAPRSTPLEQFEQGRVYRGHGGGGPALVLLSQQFDSGWSLTSEGGGSLPARPAFGWATGFDLSSGAAGYELRFGGQRTRTLLIALLVLMWMAALWLTRRPVRGP
jgi:hypothetical protein